MFAFAVGQRGSEPAMKAELARLEPTWRAGYQRPGLVTWRLPDDATAAAIPAAPPTFARVWGEALGPAPTPADVLAIATRVAASARGARAPAASPLILHVFERDLGRPGETGTTRTKPGAPPRAAAGSRAAAFEATLRALAAETAPDLFAPTSHARPGDTVLDVIVPAVNDLADEAAWVGTHRASRAILPDPGGTLTFDTPPEAPSWAYRKLEEALALYDLHPRRGDTALDLGAAPGGATYGLLRRGVDVVAIDPQPLDPRLEAEAVKHHAGLVYHGAPFGAVPLESLPPRIDWLLLDVHLAPQVALHGLTRYLAHALAQRPPRLRAAILTLKLNDWAMAETLPVWLDRLRTLGLHDVRARQLPSNRQEVSVVGLGPAA